MEILLTNVAYGPTYAHLFLDNHLNSMLDESNIPAYATDVSYIIWTDDKTEPVIKKHPNFMRLVSTLGPDKVECRTFSWKPNANTFGMRYNVIWRCMIESIGIALEKGNCLVGPWVADLVMGQYFLPKVMERINEGHDAVFMLPARGTAEGIDPHLAKIEGALPAPELFKLVFQNMHGLWQHCLWNNPLFTQLPYTLLWNSSHGLLARTYSITPILFKPKPEMMKTSKVLDIEIPTMFDNPYWASDWTEAPVVGVEPVTCYLNKYDAAKPAGNWIREWAGGHTESGVRQFLRRPLYYPNKELAKIPRDIEMAAETITKLLLVGEGETNVGKESDSSMGGQRW